MLPKFVLRDSIWSCARDTDPFLHIRMQDCMLPSFYAKLLANLPDASAYRDLEHRDAKREDGTSTRQQFTFRDKELAGLPEHQRELWTTVRDAFTSLEVAEALRRTLDINPTLKTKPRLMLIRDFPGYRIGIHPDSPSKVITCQFYLTETSGSHKGNNFYRNKPGGFELVKTMPFEPNTGYAFAVKHNSWHGVDLVTPEQGERNSLILIQYLEDTPV